MAITSEPLRAGGVRTRRLRGALRLEWFSLGWNALETVVGLAAGVAAGSVALVGFALDSVVEASSAAVLVWRLRSERSGRHTAEDAERRAVRLVAVAFVALAAYVGGRAAYDLALGARPDESVPGIVLAVVSLVVMPPLAAAKRRAARGLGSVALQADSTQTSLCTFLSAFLLVGLVANSAFGWWWADPVAGLAIAAAAAREGVALWRGDDDCCP
ncbi:MAG TPA: cation transporter [Actinomycetota bacterium]|nr:cation transporter [Actinomycetota bacterium]